VNSKTLILGIGNNLLADEGVGIHVVEHLRAILAESSSKLQNNLQLVDGGTLSFTLAGIIEDSARLIVIDATRLDAAPGTVRVFEGEDMDHFLGTGKRSSVHEVSLLDLMAVAALSGHLPQQRALIGVQPKKIDWSDIPTPAVKQAIPVVCDHVMDLVSRWTGIPMPSLDHLAITSRQECEI